MRLREIEAGKSYRGADGEVRRVQAMVRYAEIAWNFRPGGRKVVRAAEDSVIWQVPTKEPPLVRQSSRAEFAAWARSEVKPAERKAAR